MGESLGLAFTGMNFLMTKARDLGGNREHGRQCYEALRFWLSGCCADWESHFWPTKRYFFALGRCVEPDWEPCFSPRFVAEARPEFVASLRHELQVRPPVPR